MEIETAVFCWGSTINGELGLGGIEEDFVLKPRQLDTFDKSNNVQDFACGRYHTVAILSDGSLYSCGNNDSGQLGHDLPARKFQPIVALSAHSAWLVGCGESHTIAVTSAGEAFSWGNNSYGQLGLATEEESMHTPRVIRSLAISHKVVQVACGYHHSLALVENGALFSWGQNTNGQLGIGNTTNRVSVPTEVTSLLGMPIAQIAAGGHHSLILTKSGALFSWGKNTFGQLGLGDCENRHYPTQLKTMRYQKVKYICCGENHSTALTQAGGVFTFGSGMYGQLGHGNHSNEVLPKQVMELMGTVVTQIACGRCHTLAYVPSRGRIYAFGLGGNGQLGTGAADNRNSPIVVPGTWVHHPEDSQLVEATRYISKISRQLSVMDVNESTAKPDSQQMECETSNLDCDPKLNQNTPFIIHKIICGGNQSFVVSSQEQAHIQPQDFRVDSQENQILSIQPSLLHQLGEVLPNGALPLDAISQVETVFTSVSCLNGSFLTQSDDHLGCNSKNHGIDFSLLYRCFNEIENAKNATVPELVSNCLKELLPKLSTTPPDAEALRVYLILPQFHLFHDTIRFLVSLIWPFAAALVNLDKNGAKVIDLWWSKLEERFFRNLVQIYTKSVAYLLNENADIYQAYPGANQMRSFLEFLLKLNKVNIGINQLVPYQEFYIPEITDKIDVSLDYVRWLRSENNSAGSKLCFCDYPFVFDAQAKTVILQTDSHIQMEVASINSCRLAFAAAPVIISDPFLILQVVRERLIDSTIAQLNSHVSADLKKPLKVIFLGEDAVDAGGVRKEFFLLLLREILDPKYGMFKEFPETRCIWFNTQCFEDDTMYYVIGIVCGLAIYNFTIIDLPFPLVLYKKLLDEKVKLEDLRGLSPTLTKSLQDLLDYEGDDIEEVFSLNFSVSIEVFGDIVTYDLKKNGNQINVDKNNRTEYVDLYVDFMLNKSITNSFSAFSKGFLKVCGSRVLALFHAQELMALVIGNEDYKWEELEQNAVYKNEYSSENIHIRHFWSVFHSFSQEQKKKFLLFLTGSDRIPILGMKAVKIIIQPVHSDDNYLPVAHTCFNLLDLPKYSSEEILRNKLLQAIEHTQGFGFA